MSKAKALIFISGNGSNLQNIINNIHSGYINMDIVAVVSDNPEANGLKKAKIAKIETIIIDMSKDDLSNLSKIIDENLIDIFILAGFMKILPEEFINKYNGKILNVHPSLLPKYKGLNTHKKVLKSEDRMHGASVHFVTSELDEGPIIIQGKINVTDEDSEDSLKKRVHEIEYQIYPIAIKWFTENHIKQSGNKCLFNNEVLECPIEHLSE